MKDIKTFLIGFLTCACLFLIMGQTKADNQNGRYQGFADSKDNWLVNTATGELFKQGVIDSKVNKQSWIVKMPKDEFRGYTDKFLKKYGK